MSTLPKTVSKLNVLSLFKTKVIFWSRASDNQLFPIFRVNLSKIRWLYCYRPHPKDRGRYCFQFVSSHLHGGDRGHPIPGPDKGYPILLMGEYPHLRSGWGVTPSCWQGGTPNPRSGQGSTLGYPIKTEWGVPPFPGLDGVLPPSPIWRQISIVSTLATRRAVCLLRSRRKTFLF